MTRSDPLYGRQLGDFVLRDCIDEGGFGAVYRCEQSLLGREAVVKVMHERVRADGIARQRFSVEARLAARLEHPYAAHVYAFGVEPDGLIWIAMELVHGMSLKEYLDEHSSMSLEAFVPFFERLADVVHAAHEEGIVHRDLKPANVMIYRGNPKLLDFGAARLLTDTAREAAGLRRLGQDAAIRKGLASDLTPTDGVIGTPAYSSPEIWLGNGAGPAADVYALGVMAFEALTGRRPYREETFMAFGVAHMTGKIPKTGDPVLDRVFARALAKRPEDRYESAPELAAALRGVLDRKRRKQIVRRIGMVVAGVCAAAVVGVFQGVAHYNRRIAEQQAADAQETARRVTMTAELEQGRAALLGGDMQGAQQHLGAAWEMGDHSRTTRFMLDRAEQPLKAELARLPAAHGRMWSASWSPDGRWIATTDDGGAQIWDGTTYGPLRTLPHGDTVYAAVWMSDGRLATACGDGAVRVWDVRSGEVVREMRVRGKAPRWYVVAVSGERVAAVDAKGAIAAVWDVESGRVLTEGSLAGAGWPTVAFSADGRWLAASGGAAVEILDVATWRRTLTLGEQVRAIAWDPSGPQLLTGGEGGHVSIWIAPTGHRRQLRESGDPVGAVAWSSDGKRIAFGFANGTVLAFDADSRQIVSSANVAGDKVAAIEFSPDGQRLAVASAAGSVALLEASTGMQLIAFDGLGAVWGARFDRRGHVLAASWSGTARIWNAKSPYRQWNAGPIGNGNGLFGGAEPDGRYLAIVVPGGPTRVWDTAKDRLLAELPEVPATNDNAPVPFPAVSADGSRAAIALGNTAEVYELPGGRLVRKVAHRVPITALAFRGDELVSGDAAGTVLVEERILATHGNAMITALAILSGGRIAMSDAGRVQILDEAGVATAAFDTGGSTRMLRPSPDGRRLLVVPFHAGKVAPMSLVDVDLNSAVKLDGPPVYAARWTKAGILSAHADGAARLWNPDGAIARTYHGGTRFLADADLSPDGSMVIGDSGDGMLRIWDLATGKPLWVASAHRRVAMGLHVEGGDLVTRGTGGEVSRWDIPAPRCVFKFECNYAH